MRSFFHHFFNLTLSVLDSRQKTETFDTTDDRRRADRLS